MPPKGTRRTRGVVIPSARSGKSGAKAPAQVGVVQASAPRRKIPGGLDSQAMRYARLLNDPCNASLTPGVYAGSSTAAVQRFEVDFVTGSGATETGACVVFIPGLGLNFSQGTSITSDSSAFLLGPSTGSSPGYTFLSTIASSFRCVAACMQISYPGAESGRSGVVAAGLLKDTTFVPSITTAAGGGNATTTVGGVRTALQHTERTPAGMIEIAWMPGPGDERDAQFPASASPVDFQGRNALAMSVSGLPLATGVRVRLVACYEYEPRLTQGIVSVVAPPESKYTLNDVLRFIDKKLGPNWYLHVSKALGQVMLNNYQTRGPLAMNLL